MSDKALQASNRPFLARRWNASMASRDKKQLKRATPGEQHWTITKREVVSSLLARSIRLFICDHDMIPAHVLAGAANEIVSVLAKAKGVATLRAQMLPLIVEAKRDLFIPSLNHNYNFMKHSDRDIDGKNEHYHPPATEFLLYETCYDFMAVFGEGFLEPTLFLAWYSFRYPDTFTFETDMEAFRSDFGDVNSSDFTVATYEFAKKLREADGIVSLDMQMLSRFGPKGPFIFDSATSAVGKP